MIAEHPVLVRDGDVADAGARQNQRRRLAAGKPGEHSALVVALINRFDPRRRPERQRQSCDEQYPNHKLPFVFVLLPSACCFIRSSGQPAFSARP